MDACQPDGPERRRNGAHIRPGGQTYAELSARIDAMPAAAFGWSQDLCGELGLDAAATTIGVLLAHCDARNRTEGAAGYLSEALNRREGRPQAEAVLRIDPLAEYEQLGRLIRAELDKRGLGDEPTLKIVADAIRAACERVMDDPGA